MQAQTFVQVVEANTEQSDDKAIAAMGILNTLETICTVMEEKKDLLQLLIVNNHLIIIFISHFLLANEPTVYLFLNFLVNFSQYNFQFLFLNFFCH